MVAVPPLDVIRAEQRRRDFGRWLQWRSPELDWSVPHLELIRRELVTVDEGPQYLVISVPVRHGKTTLCTQHFPAWELFRDPTLRIIATAYNQDRADEYGREAMKIAIGGGVSVPPRQAVSEWRTAEGGFYKSVGVGGGVTGWGADRILVDDPFKNREEAESPAYRKRVFEWFRDDLFTRREPGASVILVQSRYHVEDLIGMVLREMPQYNWRNIRIPAIAEDDDVLGREPGDALWPARYPIEELLRAKSNGEYSFAGLYQQSPFPSGMSLYKVERLEYCEVGDVPRGMKTVRGWDLASTGKETADKTASCKITGPDRSDHYYVLDAYSGQWDIEDRNKTMIGTGKADGVKVRWELPEDPGAAGKDSVHYLKREIRGKTPITRIGAQRINKNKVVMSDPFRTAVNEGRVHIVRGDWNDAFVSALRAFPNVDDESDAAALAFRKLFALKTTDTDDDLPPLRGTKDYDDQLIEANT